jgi:hypothetical protein
LIFIFIAAADDARNEGRGRDPDLRWSRHLAGTPRLQAPGGSIDRHARETNCAARPRTGVWQNSRRKE